MRTQIRSRSRVYVPAQPCLVEKPLCTTHSEGQRLVDVFKTRGVPLYVAYYRRFLPRFLHVKQLIDSGHIGRVVSVSVQLKQRSNHIVDVVQGSPMPSLHHTWRLNPEISGGGKIFDLGSHTFDILDFILGPIDHISGLSINSSVATTQTKDSDGTVVSVSEGRNLTAAAMAAGTVATQTDTSPSIVAPYLCEDVSTAVFRFKESNAIGTALFHFNWAGQTEVKRVDLITIDGTLGSITCPIFEDTGFHSTVLTSGEPFATRRYHPHANPKHVHEHLVRAVVDHLQARRGSGSVDVFQSTGESALRTQDVLDRCVDSYYHHDERT